MLYLTLFEITMIVVLIVDISGITSHISRWISHWLTEGKFVVDDIITNLGNCSFCINFWAGLIYLLVTNQFSIFALMFVLLCSFFTETIVGMLYFVKDWIAKIISKLTPKE